MKNVLKPLAKNVLMSLGLTAESATDAGIHKKMFGFGNTTLIISNEKINDVMKTVKSLEESGLLIKKMLAKLLKMKQKNKNAHFSVCY